MSAGPACSHHIEWPAAGARLRGPVVWIHGWIMGSPGHDLVDVRARSHGQVHLGLLGLPRTDLAAHFKSPQPWLPAEFVVGVALPDGPAEIYLEAQDAFGGWHGLQTLTLTVAPDGEPDPRASGRFEPRPGGSSTGRDPHRPFHGHLDAPPAEATLEYGGVKIFGWLLHESQKIKNVWATTDLLVFHPLEHGVTDDALAANLPELPQARFARLRGAVPVPPTLSQPACLRIYAELADGSMHLCLAQRLTAKLAAVFPLTSPLAQPARVSAALTQLPSGRPRRILLCTLNLQRDDSTLRVLDIARHLTKDAQWSARLLTTTDGPLRADFESLGVSVQIVSPQSFFSATSPATAETALSAIGRQIWFKHLDAMAVFDASCEWAARLAQQNHVPVLVDYASVIPPWHSVELPVRHFHEPGQRPSLLAPIRGRAEQGAATLLHAADWLTRHHPDFCAHYRLVITDVRDTPEEIFFVQDVVHNQPGLMAVERLGLERAVACVCPAFSDHPTRALLDAAAMGVPIVTTESPALRETFTASEVTVIPAGNPLALAHALVDVMANPDAAQRRAEAAQRRVRTGHAPGPLLQRWQAALERAVVAARRLGSA
ncbi:MAG: glycosyltransferase [Opitutaceae bacterium]